MVDEVEDVATVLGNLIDNAIAAAVGGNSTAKAFVEVTLMDEGDTLVAMVADSGAGIAPGQDVFAPSTSDSDAVHGHGIGLKLSRELARRRGGDLWIIDPGTVGAGAVFGVRIPRAMVVETLAQDGNQEGMTDG
jgi:two-component system CitB family sensor kinase